MYIYSILSGHRPLFVYPQLEYILPLASPASRLETEIRQLFEDEGVVLLELTSSGNAGRLTLRIIADRRTAGVSIDDCVRLSRQIQHLVSEKNLLNEDYRLEVSSPGLDYPLREEWQFTKNIGRLLKVQIPGAKGPKEVSGRLSAVDAEGITLTSESGEWKPSFKDVLSARVLPEFKPPRMESKP
jgi:ribosome maturation factor RimP